MRRPELKSPPLVPTLLGGFSLLMLAGLTIITVF